MMARGNCAICNHIQHDAIDDALAAGRKLNDVAMEFAVSKFSLSRHRAKHLAVASAPVASDADLELQVNKWRERADALWHQATADADVRGQAQAVAAGLRSVELQARQEQSEETKPPSGADAPITLEQIDAIIRKSEETPRGRIQNRLSTLSDAALELAVRLAETPSAWTAVRSILENTQVN